MPTVNVVIDTELKRSTRVRQLESMFDVPAQEKCRLEWNIEMPDLSESDWSVGLIVGPSGSGKSTSATSGTTRPNPSS